MRAKIFWLAGLLTAWMALAGGWAWAQGPYSPPDIGDRPGYSGDGGFLEALPLYSTQPGQGGFFAAMEFVALRQTVPLRNQGIAYRGFVDTDGSITGNPGTFVGSEKEALNSRNVSGPQTYAPGFDVQLGWRFSGDQAPTLTFSWTWLTSATYRAAATLIPPFQQVGPQLADSFLFSPVYAFPNQYAGPPFKVAQGNAFAVFGIWNGASVETLQFQQKFQQYDFNYRVPFYETECYRLSGEVGPRFIWIWESFRWEADSIDDTTGVSGPTDGAIYTNVVSNRMYGCFVGCDQEWYLGHGLACELDLQAGAYADIVKERAKYQFVDRFAAPQSKSARTDWSLVGEAVANVQIKWYPKEGIVVRAGYNLMGFINTIASPTPVGFNYGAPDPAYEHVSRFFDGLNIGLALIF